MFSLTDFSQNNHIIFPVFFGAFGAGSVPHIHFFNLLVFFIRFAGIINSINTNSAWRTSTLSEENMAFKDTVKKDTVRFRKVLSKFREVVNNPEDSDVYEA